jgi:hypothetical protein
MSDAVTVPASACRRSEAVIGILLSRIFRPARKRPIAAANKQKESERGEQALSFRRMFVLRLFAGG